MGDKSTTPRPWGIQDCSNGGKLILRGQFGLHQQSHVQIVPAEDAELICKAVNQYDHVAELVLAAQEALMQIEYIEEKFDAGTSTGEATKTRLRSALAKMEVSA